MTPLEWYALAVSALLAFTAFWLLTQANDAYDWAARFSALLGELHKVQDENDDLRQELDAARDALGIDAESWEDDQ